MKPHYAQLYKWKLTPFQWGLSDCMISIADYLRDLTGIDPAEEFRGLYDDAFSCQRVTGFLSDPLGLFERCVMRIPLERAAISMDGDVGVIQIAGSTDVSAIGAICLGATGNWAVRGKSGLIIGRPSQVLASWSVAPWRHS